jgi:hypothetical protein
MASGDKPEKSGEALNTSGALESEDKRICSVLLEDVAITNQPGTSLAAISNELRSVRVNLQ